MMNDLSAKEPLKIMFSSHSNHANQRINMKTQTVTALLLLLPMTQALAQNKPMLVFDLLNGSMDSITGITYDPAIQMAQTPYFIGQLDDKVEVLAQTPPTDHIYPNTQFTLKENADALYDINQYPLRTSVKLFYVENDSLHDLCSGSFISRRHILTSAHCVSNPGSSTPDIDSIYVCPVYNNGTSSPNFNCGFAQKVYFYRNWNISGEDFAVLELEEPMGEKTGWISIGFNQIDSLLAREIFYKFSYPSSTIPSIDPNTYNGDTLYFNYGKADLFQTKFIGINHTAGIPGESGSSIIAVQNNARYTTYGVLTWSSNLSHSRINAQTYYTLRHIISDDVTLGDASPAAADFLIFPNPTSDWLSIQNLPESLPVHVRVMDGLGRTVFSQNNCAGPLEFNFSDLPNGLYRLMVFRATDQQIIANKGFVKQEP